MSKHDHLLEASALLDKHFGLALADLGYALPSDTATAVQAEALAQVLSLTISALREHITQHHD